MTASTLSGFRKRLWRRDPLFGTFIKTPAPHIIEIVGAAGFDFVVNDEEHGSFDRSTIDSALLAARTVNIPALVRCAQSSPSHVLPTGVARCRVGMIEPPHRKRDS